MLLDEAITNGINRNFVQKLFKGVSLIVLNAIFHHNFQEINDRMVVNSDEEGEKTTRLLIDCLFLDRNASLYKEAPFLAILVNTHREALCFSFFVGLIAISVLSYTYAVYFLILWSVQLVMYVFHAYMYSFYFYFGLEDTLTTCEHLKQAQRILTSRQSYENTVAVSEHRIVGESFLKLLIELMVKNLFASSHVLFT